MIEQHKKLKFLRLFFTLLRSDIVNLKFIFWLNRPKRVEHIFLRVSFGGLSLKTAVVRSSKRSAKITVLRDGEKKLKKTSGETGHTTCRKTEKILEKIADKSIDHRHACLET